MSAVGMSAVVACQRDPGPPPPVQPPVAAVRGDERLEWEQAALGGRDPASYRFVAYIDGEKTDLLDVTCRVERAATKYQPPGYRCNSRLPTLRPGRRVLSIAAISTHNGTTFESPRSAPLIVEKP